MGKSVEKWVYVAGPMSGYEELNFPAFYEAEERLKDQGYFVVNPASLSTNIPFPDGSSDDDVYKACMRHDIQALIFCDFIYLLPGWEKSKGAQLEKTIADFFEMKVLNL